MGALGGKRPVVKDPRRYRVIGDYLPQMEDEIELRAGQVMVIKKVFGDGWANGLNLTTGKEGTFPLQNIESI
ncbi:hypothetical protein HK101_003461 [Irineochytrium annulatum]|nr:hypothetical protein HK101_003461 [Irineochytrium annulatum]